MHPLPQPYFSRLLRAIIEFDLIQANDRILIGLSGGKDSLFLTYALAMLQKNSSRPFYLGAFTLDPMFSSDFDTDKLASFCRNLGISYAAGQANIAGAIAKDGADPCFTCAFFRRGAVNRYAVENNYNKVALAHHHDDAVETFLMGLLHSGQLKTFLPKTYLSRTGLTVIRPLIYFRERELAGTAQYHGCTPVPSPCPFNGKTKRQEIKELIAALDKANPGAYDHLAAAMRGTDNIELWPPVPGREELKRRSQEFWRR